MDDQVSRQAAIKIIKNYCENGCDISEDNWCPSCQREQFIKLLEALPSAQPERKKGTWIMEYKGYAVTSYKCSECGRTVKDDTDYDVSKDYPFCHCGADMRGDENDQSK